MQPLCYILFSAKWKDGIIQENIFRNRKLGDDPYSAKWHWWQGLQYAAVLCMIAAANWHLLFYEAPLSALFAVVFNGVANVRTFGNPFWYVPPVRYGLGNAPIYAGSRMDKWLQQKRSPVLWLKVLQGGMVMVGVGVFIVGKVKGWV